MLPKAKTTLQRRFGRRELMRLIIKYFYIFGLNLKFCRAIDEYVEAQSDAYLETNQKIMRYFYQWRRSSGCFGN